MPTPAFTPVTNGDFFENIGFNTNPNAAGVEQSLLTLGATRSNEFDTALELASQSRRESTERLNELNDTLAALQNQAQNPQPQFQVPESGVRELFEQIFPGQEFDPSQFPVGDQGVTFIDADVIATDADALENFTQTVENRINEVSSESQLDLIRFQALVNRRNQTVEFLSNLIQRFFSQRERTPGNLRA